MYYKSRKKDKKMFLMSRKGDWFIAPYQCKKCWFFNVCGILPRRPRIGDRHKLDVLRRANPDIFWSRDTATVKGVLRCTKEIERRAREEGMLVPLPVINPWPVRDGVGMGVAIQILEKSLCKVRNRRNYLQFNTFRQLRASVSDVNLCYSRLTRADAH